MKSRDREWHQRTTRQALVHALWLLENGAPAYAMVYAILAVDRFSKWVDIDAVEKAARDLTERK